ncbi:MAG TPA: GLPGLI family protein [Chitinophagales bacterium]|nr:GLPGLI family protein [Chitinophagales bacterium]
MIHPITYLNGAARNFLLLITFLSVNIIANAQTSGTVKYEERAKLHFNIQGDAPPPVNLPTERTTQTVLYFTPDASLYEAAKGQNAPDVVNEESDGNNVHIRMDVPDNKTFCDLRNSKRIDQRDFMQRKFLITNDLKISDWKLTGKQKMILNYPCQEATRQDKDRKITVWFTSAIPVSSGPSAYCGLPGLVLEVIINDGDQTITATSVTFENVDASVLVKPKEGKKVSQEEYDKIVADKMKEMGVENGNNVIIRVNNN